MTILITGLIGSGKSAAARRFEARGIPVYDSDSRCKALYDEGGIFISDWESLLAQKDTTVTFTVAEMGNLADYAALDAAIARREAHEPLAYIVGSRGFWRDDFIVTKDTLIPRPETELLVETAVRMLPRGARFADLCTGTGCVGLSILRERPDLTVTLVDLFPATLDVARANAAALGLAPRVTFVQADVLDPAQLTVAGAPWDAVVSNPPYIPTRVIPTLSPEVLHEPSAALDGGDDGLTFYRAMLSGAEDISKGPIYFEIGYDQGDALPAIAAAHGYSCEIIPDLAGLSRVAVVRS